MPPPRRPAQYVALDGDERHQTPLCPDLQGQPYRMVGAETATYVYGERRCGTCRLHRHDWTDSGWTDPRFRQEDDSR
jgi:hypothetical protein